MGRVNIEEKQMKKILFNILINESDKNW